MPSNGARLYTAQDHFAELPIRARERRPHERAAAYIGLVLTNPENAR